MKRLLTSALFLILFLHGAAQPQRASICAEEMDTMRARIDAGIVDERSLETAVPRLDSAIQLALQSDTLAWCMPEWRALIRLYMLQGYYQEEFDHFLQAKRTYEAGIAVVERFGLYDPYFVYFLYRPLGNVFSRLEETAQAALLHERCIVLLEDSLAFNRAARSANDWAISLQSRGLLKQGIEVLEHALAFPESSEDTRARLHQIMTGILLDSFELAPNAVLLQQATLHADSAYYWLRVAYGQDSDFEEIVSDLIWLKGKLDYLSGDLKSSEKYFERAVRAVSSNDEGPNRALAKVLVQYARMRIYSNNFAAALTLYQQMLHALIPSCPADSAFANPVDSQLYAEYALIDALVGKAEAIYRSEDTLRRDRQWLRTAWEACQLAFQAEDTMRALYTFEETKLSFAAESHQRMELGLEILFQLRALGDPAASDAAIYQLFERNQSQIMAEYLKGLAEGGLVPLRLQARETQARIEMTQYSQQIAGEADSTRLRLWQQKLRAAGQALNAVKDSIRLLHPTYFAFRYSPSMIPLHQIQSQIAGSRDGMIQYFWGERSVFRLLILKDRVAFDWLGPVKEFEPYLQFLDNPGAAKNQSTLPEDLYQLHQRLWKDRAQEIPFRVAVVPDGPLWQVPFEALLTHREEKLGSESHYLIRDHSIYYAFSASIQWWLEKTSHRPAITTGYVGLMPSLENDPNLALTAMDRPNLSRFASEFGGERFQGASASRNTLVQSKGCAAVLHFNSHAVWNAQRPYDSFIALESASGGVDSFDLDDIMAMSPKGQLVVLEACRSGIGNIRSGEGMESLAKGFILSGAAAVISTNLDVNPTYSANLMDRFFDGLGVGDTLDLALRSAKLAYLKDEHVAAEGLMPWVWGAFRPYGAMYPLPLQPVSHASFWLIVGGCLLAFLAAILLLLRRRFPTPNLPKG